MRLCCRTRFESGVVKSISDAVAYLKFLPMLGGNHAHSSEVHKRLLRYRHVCLPPWRKEQLQCKNMPRRVLPCTCSKHTLTFHCAAQRSMALPVWLIAFVSVSCSQLPQQLHRRRESNLHAGQELSLPSRQQNICILPSFCRPSFLLLCKG